MTKSLHCVNHNEIRLHHIATDHHLCNKNGWLLQEPVTFVISLMMRACPRWAPFLLPSATKLLRLYFHRRLSVHRGGVYSRGRSALGGCLVRGVGIPACTEADPPGRDYYCCGWYASYWNAFLLLEYLYFVFPWLFQSV